VSSDGWQQWNRNNLKVIYIIASKQHSSHLVQNLDHKWHGMRGTETPPGRYQNGFTTMWFHLHSADCLVVIAFCLILKNYHYTLSLVDFYIFNHNVCLAKLAIRDGAIKKLNRRN